MFRRAGSVWCAIRLTCLEGITRITRITQSPRNTADKVFITDGIHAALERAREAAKGKDVNLGAGADVAAHFKYRLKQ